MFMKYSSLECCEFILAFQLQFGIYEAESERFRSEKETHHLNEWFSRQVHLLYIGYLADVRFLKPVFNPSDTKVLEPHRILREGGVGPNPLLSHNSLGT